MRGDLIFHGVVFMEEDVFQNLKTVGRDLLISESTFASLAPVMPYLPSLQQHTTSSKTYVIGDTYFCGLTNIGGDLVTQENEFFDLHEDCSTFQML